MWHKAHSFGRFRQRFLSLAQLPVAVLTDPAALSEHMPLKKTVVERLELPS